MKGLDQIKHLENEVLAQSLHGCQQKLVKSIADQVRAAESVDYPTKKDHARKDYIIVLTIISGRMAEEYAKRSDIDFDLDKIVVVRRS